VRSETWHLWQQREIKKKLPEHAKRIELPLENPFDSTISLAMLAI